MKILQINALYAKLSTGRTTREMHEYFLSQGIDSYVAAPNLGGLNNNCYKIGNKIDYKVHALLSRITGKQAYYSIISTKKLLVWMDNVRPDVVILRNLHSNYINLPILTRYLRQKNIVTVIVLHDSWFITGGCTYYVSSNCNKWQTDCDKCPQNQHGNNGWFRIPSKIILNDRKKYLDAIPRLAVIGVSQWVADDAKKSVLSNAFCIKCIYNWIDQNKFIPKDRYKLREMYGFSKDKFIILGVSSCWSESKGISVFHNIANKLSDEYQVVLIGDSSCVEHRHEKVIYLPQTHDLTHLADLYALANVFVNPTIQETFGKTTAEALSCGIPVIAYNGTATKELVGDDGKCGYLIDTLSPDEYVLKIKLVHDKGTNTYIDNCRQRSTSMFNMEKNLNQYLSLFKEMLQI